MQNICKYFVTVCLKAYTYTYICIYVQLYIYMHIWNFIKLLQFDLIGFLTMNNLLHS